jgi:CheY-like chemotaxis protein
MIGNLLKRSPKQTQTYSVLIIHDDNVTALRISALLTNQGHHVMAATSSAEAFPLLDDTVLPDVFIIDLLNPEDQGKKFLDQARIRFGKAALPSVLVLADAVHDEWIAHEVDAEDVLPKPFEDDELLSRLMTLVEARRPKVSARK